MKMNQLKIGVILSYATQAVHILSGLLYTPIMLRLLGQSEYGLYQLVNSVVSYLSLLSLGFAASYVRFYSRYKVRRDVHGIANLNGLFMVIFVIIAIVCILCGIVMVYNAKAIFGNGLTETELSKAKVLLGIMVFNMAATFINSVFSSIITAHEKFFFQKLVSFLKVLFNPFITLPLLIMGCGSVAMVVVTTGLTITALLADTVFCLKKLKVRFVFRSLDFSLFKEMWGFTFFLFVGMIVNQVNWSIGKFLLGRMIGTVAVAIFGLAAQLNSMYLTLSTSVSNVFIPRVNNMVAKNEDKNELNKLFIKVGRIQFLILGLIITGYIIFGKEFIGFWAGQGYDEAYIIGLFLMVPVTVPLIQNLGIEILIAKNRHKTRAMVYLLVAVFNVLISVPCIKRWGASGAAVGTAISLIAGNVFFINWYYHKKMELNMITFWKSIFGIFVPMAIAAVLGVVTKRVLMRSEGVVCLLLAIIVYCIIYLLMIWFFGMNVQEKNLLIKPLEKVRKKLCRR